MNRLSALLINPVLNKEIKLRFRSFKNYVGIFLFVAICGAVCLAFIYTETQFSGDGFTSSDSRNLFWLLSFGQLGLIVFITPGLTSGAISSERERQTLNILLTTQQSSTSIILSKLFSSLLFLLLMVSATLPLYSIVFLYGGVSPQMVLMVFGFHLLTMLTIGSLGILFSTIIRKTMVATITTYGTMLFFTVGTLVIFLIAVRIIIGFNTGVQTTNNFLPYLALMLNPIATMFSVYEPSLFLYELQQIGIKWPLWIGFALSYATITVLALLLAISRLRPRIRTMKKKG
ncbi:ABC transporter permease [Radiobacillus sp. PE A8.2]|uniref:ABC transporter permease n=1 Tax=Radiobacillus sp. PE A8.2 TaxID=3380349 RepID=UPI00388D1C16